MYLLQYTCMVSNDRVKTSYVYLFVDRSALSPIARIVAVILIALPFGVMLV